MPCIYATSHKLFTAVPGGRITGEDKRLHCPSDWLAWCWRIFWAHASHQQHTSGLPENPLLSPTPVFSKPGGAGSDLLQCPSTRRLYFPCVQTQHLPAGLPCTCSAHLIIHGCCWQPTLYLTLEPLLSIFPMPSVDFYLFIYFTFCSIFFFKLSTWVLPQMVNPSLDVWSIVLSCSMSSLVPWWHKIPLGRYATFCCNLSVHRIFGCLCSAVLNWLQLPLRDDTVTLSRCTPHHTS